MKVKSEREVTQSCSYDKHKIFLYKEDFEKFAEGLEDAVAFIRGRLGGETPQQGPAKSFTDVHFDEF